MAGTTGKAPPPLSMPLPSRPPLGSVGSSTSYDRSPSPDLSALDSSAALILVHDDEEDEQNPFQLENGESDEDDDEFPSQYDVRKPSIPPLRPSLVFLYLLAPYLKLGAMFLVNTELPIEQGLPPLLAFALLSAFSRQLWFMLGRYIRKLDMEDVILDAFARGRGKERRRSILRSVVRAGTGGLRVLITAVYLRESTNIFLSIFGEFSWAPRLLLTAIIAIVLLPLIFAHSIASKSVVYSTWLSIVTYVVWLGFIVLSYIQGIPLSTPGWLKMGAFWQGIALTSFAFTTSSTLSLYSSLRGHQQASGSLRTSRKQSFRTLSFLSVLVSVALTLPLVFFAAYPRVQDTYKPSQTPIKITTSILTALTLLLNIPALIITSPALPIPDRIRVSTSLPLSRLLLTMLSAGLSILPDIGAVVLSDILILSAFTSTYFLPAFIHVTTHFFKRPLAIVVPQTPRTSMSTASPGPASAGSEPGSATRNDELLLRKERALQRRQWKKRILWDLGVWVLLLGGGAGFVWAIGRVAGRW